MKIHDRTMIVQRASSDLLTILETLSILTENLRPLLNHALRYERHGDYDKKADEA